MSRSPEPDCLAGMWLPLRCLSGYPLSAILKLPVSVGSPMQSRSVSVPLAAGEEARGLLRDLSLLRTDLRPKVWRGRLYLPVNGPLPAGALPGAKEGRAVFEAAKARQADYRPLVRMPERLKPLLPSSYDAVGDIGVVKLKREVWRYRRAVGDALRAVHGFRAVAADGGVSGPARRRSLTVIAGAGPLRALHRENGIALAVDLEKAYFSPRLATERARVASLVKPGEVVVDMFAGVGPFPVLIAKRVRPASVWAIDSNPHAVELMKENIRMNRVERVVRPVLGDGPAEAVRARREEGRVDRIIMNLPQTAEGYLPGALEVLSPGGTVHLYLRVEDMEAKRVELEKAHRTAVAARVVHPYSPREVIAVFDMVKVKPGAFYQTL